MNAGDVNAADTNPEEVAGERATTPVTRSVSVQSRLSNLLAVSLMSVLGLGTLVWYYANNASRQARIRSTIQSAAANHAAGDSVLPRLGRIDAPLPPAVSREIDSPPPTDAPPVSGADRAALTATTLPEIPLAANAAGYTAPPPPSPEELAQQRQLSGAVFSNSQPGPGVLPPEISPVSGPPPASVSAAPLGALAPLLHAVPTPAARAEMLPAQRLLLPKGAFIDCTLETAIDSTLPGMTTCVMATDVFGVDGKVVLMERGTKLIGETQGQVQQGQARVFVLWTEARTPAGVVVPLASPGADELGRSGLPGEVNRHFWERFGAAMLISIVDGAVEAASTRNGSGSIVVDPAGSQSVMTEVLKGTVNIPPTVMKKNGDRIQVLVARDLDFRSVYELRAATSLR
jgi:type IV secretion system protein VirB10